MNMSATETEQAGQASNREKVQRTAVGVVVSDKRDKTRTVAVQYQARHSKYGKYLQRQGKYHVHDANNQSKAGDRVEIAPCRPMSKKKSWRLVRVIEASAAV